MACSLNAVLFFTSGIYFHNATRWPPHNITLSHSLQNDIWKHFFFLYCSVANKYHKITLLYIKLKKQFTWCVELVHIGQQIRAAQSSRKCFGRMVYHRKSCSGSEQQVHSQSRSAGCPCCRGSGKSWVRHAPGCGSSDSLRHFLALCYSCFCARRNWRKSPKAAQNLLLAGSSGISGPSWKLMMVFRGLIDKRPLMIGLHRF